jgi:hypothetical protein
VSNCGLWDTSNNTNCPPTHTWCFSTEHTVSEVIYPRPNTPPESLVKSLKRRPKLNSFHLWSGLNFHGLRKRSLKSGCMKTSYCSGSGKTGIGLAYINTDNRPYNSGSCDGAQVMGDRICKWQYIGFNNSPMNNAKYLRRYK